jgi:prepilin-type N-terminal cleavage/methylation domain-containing protein
MKKSQIRKGLTLLELVVVLMILVALAGILVPLLPSMLSRAHTATHATNVVELTKAAEAFNLFNHGYPDYLDQLTNTAGTAIFGTYGSTPSFPGLSSDAKTACGGHLVAAKLEAGEADPLKAAGLTHIQPLTAASTNLLDPAATYMSAAAEVADGLGVAQLDATSMQNLFNESTTSSAKYYVFGLGAKSNIVGHGIPEAPTHFGDESKAGGNSSLTYSRFGLVFRVANSSGTTLETAQFAGVVAFHEGEVSNATSGISEYNSLSTNNQ